MRAPAFRASSTSSFRALELRAVVERAELDALLEAVAHLHAPGQRREPVDARELLGYVDALDRAAHLAAVLEGAPEELLRDRIQLHVVEHDRGVVATELERQPLEVGRGRGCHLLAGLDRAGEGDLARHRMRRHPGAERVAA
jgi:hypothetical protein